MPDTLFDNRIENTSRRRRIGRHRKLLSAAAILAASMLTAVMPVAAERAAPSRGDLGAGQARDPDLPWSGTVQEAQRALAELGLYRGPIDGRLTPAFERALRDYESRYGISGEITGMAALLAPVQRSGHADAIQETLERARREQIEHATTVLLRDAATRDLMQAVPDERADPTRRPEACLDAPTAQCLLAEAVETAKSIGRDDYRNWAFRDILRAQAALGEDADARESIRRLTDPRLKIVALREMVEELARQGRLDDARDLAWTIPDPRNRASALAAIASRHAATGDREAARDGARQVQQTAAEVGEIGLRIDILAALAQGLAEGGAGEAGREVLREVRDTLLSTPAGAERDAAAGVLARALAELGADADAASLVAQLEGSEARRTVDRRGAAPAGPIRTLDVAESRYRVIALAETARAQAALGNPNARDAALERALAVAETIDSPFARDYGFGRILLVQAADGDVAAALRTAERIDDSALRSRALWSGADTLRRNSQVDGATLLERASARAAEGATSAFDRIAIASEHAMAFARMGRTDAARILIRQALDMLPPIRIDWWRARALATIAQAVWVADSAPP